MKDIRHALERKKNEVGLVGTRLQFSRPQTGKGITEHITQDWKDLVIRIRKDLNAVPDAPTKRFLEKKGIDDPIWAIASDLLYHGCGHRELPVYSGVGCPHAVTHHDQILDGVAQALREKGKEGLESYVSNAFEDVLDNVNARRHTEHSGQILFWNNEGVENDGTFTPFYDAFVRINLSLWGDAAAVTLLKRFATDDPRVLPSVKEFTDYVRTRLRVDYLTRLHEKEDAFNRLFDKTHWRDLAYRFTLATANLLEDPPQMRLCFGADPEGTNQFDKLLRLPGTQEDLAHGRYKAGQGPSQHADPLLQLDALYRKLARAIPVETSEYQRAQGIPITHFGRRDLRDNETLRIRRLKGVGFQRDGKIGLKVARHDLQYPAQYKVHPRNFPKLRIALVDSSGSMGSAPDNTEDIGDTTFIPWGDNSKYHYALKGVYGVDNFLRKQGIAPYTKGGVIVFSGSSRASGTHQLGHEAERRLLLQPPSGGTSLDARVVAHETEDSCFLISISDGDIGNWHSEREAYKDAVKGTAYVHIQIGGDNTFTRDLRSWGVPVHNVHGDDDLTRLMIDLTATYYKEGDFNK